MHEAITIIKHRTEGWKLLLGPDAPMHEHIEARNALVQEGGINEEIEEIIVGRCNGTLPNFQFSTRAQEEEKKQQHAAHVENLERVTKQQQQIQKKRDGTTKQLIDAEHAVRLEKINAENDAIRNAGKKPAPAKTPASKPAPVTPISSLPEDPEEEGEGAENEGGEKPATNSTGTVIADLLAKSPEELAAIVLDINAEKGRKEKEKIKLKPDATKIQIVNAIMEARGYKLTAE